MQKQHSSDRLEVLAQGQVGTLWHLTSRASLATILASGYFARFAGYQLRLADCINVTARYGETDMQFAALAVASVG